MKIKPIKLIVDETESKIPKNVRNKASAKFFIGIALILYFIAFAIYRKDAMGLIPSILGFILIYSAMKDLNLKLG